MAPFFSWFSKPYYFNSSLKYNLILSVSFGLSIFLFLYLLQPFQIVLLENNLFYYTLGFGAITTVTLFCFYIIFPLLFKAFFNEENWTVGKHFLLLFVITLSISILNWHYNNLVQKGLDSLLTLTELITYTFGVGSLPIIIYLFIDESLSRKKRETIAKNINDSHYTPPIVLENKITIITTKNDAEFLELDLNNLVYIKSEGNYVGFFITSSDNKVKETVIRTTMKNLENQLNKNKNIIRCHKSYIVNTNHIDKVSGNARGYQLHSTKFNFSVPVSRVFSKERLKKFLN